MSIIEAKCPNCGAPLKLDTDNDASYCEFCKTPFVTEKAIKVSGDYVKGDKIINNVKQDNEHTSNKMDNITICVIMIVLFLMMLVVRSLM